ncbi:MAG: hypothetical protein EZS28_021781, partial [Streblomastix strix]
MCQTTRNTTMDVHPVARIALKLMVNGKQLVQKSTFKNCHNTEDISLRQRLNKQILRNHNADVTSGDAKFKDDTFDDSSSSAYGGAIRFLSNGEHNFKNLKFQDCTVSGNKSADDGVIYIDGGENRMEDIKIYNSQAKIVDVFQTESSSRRGVIYIFNCGADSQLKDMTLA